MIYCFTGLKKCAFVEMTDIQALSIPISLKSKDVLGAARTGSGKKHLLSSSLRRRKWGPQDGLEVLIVSPTRELASLTFPIASALLRYLPRQFKYS